MANGLNFPTILVVDEDDGTCRTLVRNLQNHGYFVLVAYGALEATQIVRVHSRPIQVLLTSDRIDDRTLASTLKKYRPDMHVLFLSPHADDERPDLLSSDGAVARVQVLLKPPANPGTEVPESRRSSAQARTSRAVA
jgi:CheY-like chemotaxis protein